MDFKIELIPVPVTDVDRAKAFYERAGFHMDIDSEFPGGRFIQFTPPGSACSIALGKGVTDMTPGTQNIQVVVESAEQARRSLVGAGVQASEIEDLPWGRFTRFADPDGNRWACQEFHGRPNPAKKLAGA